MKVWERVTNEHVLLVPFAQLQVNGFVPIPLPETQAPAAGPDERAHALPVSRADDAPRAAACGNSFSVVHLHGGETCVCGELEHGYASALICMSPGSCFPKLGAMEVTMYETCGAMTS
jgi:hypothetical protein